MKRLVSLTSTEGKTPEQVAQEVLRSLERYEPAKAKCKPTRPKK